MTKAPFIGSCGNYLVLWLLRFAQPAANRGVKLVTPLTIESTLRLRIDGELVKLECVAVVAHVGTTIEHGHFLTFVDVGGKAAVVSDETAHYVTAASALLRSTGAYLAVLKRT